MSFWNTKKPQKPKYPPLDTGQAIPVRKKIHRSPPIAFEAKLLAIEAIECGADRQDVAQVLGVKSNTISTWIKSYNESGIRGLCCKPSNKTVRKQCSELEKRIIAHIAKPINTVLCDRISAESEQSGNRAPTSGHGGIMIDIQDLP